MTMTGEEMARTREEFEGQVGEAIEVVFGSLPEAPDDTLYHYTDARGLEGMLSTNELWATHVRFMNDASEQSYAMRIIAGLLDTRLPTESSWLKAFAEQALFLCSGLWEAYEAFVVCFCEKKNLLNQWRVYAGTTGYSIGFDPKALVAAGDQPALLHNKGFELMKVIYKRSEQEELVIAVIDAVVNTLRPLAAHHGTPLGHVVTGSAINTLSGALSMLCMCFKDPAFSDEHEWRLCHQVPVADMHHARKFDPLHAPPGAIPKRGDTNVQCRSGAKGLVPYAPLDATTDWGTQPGGWHIIPKEKRLPIKEVWYGPSMHPENAKFALERLLFQWDYGDVPVKGSDIPLRP